MIDVVANAIARARLIGANVNLVLAMSAIVKLSAIARVCHVG
jgi:hypothetical protein